MTTLELTLTSGEGPPLCYRFKVSDDLARTAAARLLALLGGEQPRSPPNRSRQSRDSLAARVYAVLSDLADNSGWCGACQDDIASRTGLSTRHLRRGIASLEAAGLIQVRRRGRHRQNGYFLPVLADKTVSAQEAVLSAQDVALSDMKKGMLSEGMSAMSHDDHDESKQKHLFFLHEGERRKRLRDPHLTPDYLQAWDSWWAAGQFGRLRNPAGWANSEIKHGHWPPEPAPTLFSQMSPEHSLETSTEQATLLTPEEVLWSQVLAQLQLQLTRATFDVWLKGSRLLSRDESTFTIAAGSGFARDWLENRLQLVLCRVITQVAQVELSSIKLLFVVD